jgi:hypothetical protein
MSQPSPQEGNSQQGLGSRIHAHFARHGGVELDLSNLRNRDADLQRRARIAELFLTGEWGVELETYEADEERQREQAAESP